jgi:hypothetical protein
MQFLFMVTMQSLEKECSARGVRRARMSFFHRTQKGSDSLSDGAKGVFVRTVWSHRALRMRRLGYAVQCVHLKSVYLYVLLSMYARDLISCDDCTDLTHQL